MRVTLPHKKYIMPGYFKHIFADDPDFYSTFITLASEEAICPLL